MNTETITTASPDNATITTAKGRPKGSRNIPQEVKDAVIARAMRDGDLETILTLTGTNSGAKMAIFLSSQELADYDANKLVVAAETAIRKITPKLHKLAEGHDPALMAAIMLGHARSLVTSAEFATLIAELEN